MNAVLLYVNIFRKLDPIRWKVFQCLPIEAENMGEGALRQVEEFLVTEDEWKHFLDTHSSINCLVQESNVKMRNSYLILDEYMRFLDNSNGRKDPSKSILDVGVKAALDNSGFDEEMFVKRGNFSLIQAHEMSKYNENGKICFSRNSWLRRFFDLSAHKVKTKPRFQVLRLTPF